MSQNSQPKKHKFALLIWLFIYPVFTLLFKSLTPLMTETPSLLQNFILSLILVPLMVWGYIPFINKRFFNWLRK
ncbi:MAG: antibiotic biosynthesis monooxygenase (ABM) superfamily enzyme [Salibacteraceae bacterium]|jgi:antibiotic biosynthesis monooxygenase (ABM) superfamily enzyme